MKRHLFKRQIVSAGYGTTHLKVFLGRAVAASVIKADTNIKQSQVMALLDKLVNGNSRINAS